MTQQEKARVYDDCLRQSDNLQRLNSKLKSENLGRITPDIEKQLSENERQINLLVKKVESLFYS